MIEQCRSEHRNDLVDYLYPTIEKINWILPDKSKLRRMIEVSTSASNSLCLIARRSKWIVGGLSLSVEELPWGHKRYGRVDIIGGANDEILQALISEMMVWVKSRRGILSLTYMFPVRTRALYLLGQAGFGFEGSVFLWRRYDGVSKQDLQAG